MKYKSLMVISFSLIFILSSFTICQSSLIEENNTISSEEQNEHTNITNDPKWQISSSIHGDNIVWEDYRDDQFGTWSSPGNRNSNIYLYNIEMEELFQITTNTSTQINPDIWGDYVVWEDYRNERADIYYADISGLIQGEDADINQLTNNDADQVTPRIHNGIVVWEDQRENHYGDIYMYNLLEYHGPYRINTRQGYGDHDFIPHNNPDIYEDKIVWTDYRQKWRDTNRGDIFLYDLSVDSNDNGIPNYRDPEIGDEDPAEIQIADDHTHQHSPSIYKDTVVWVEYNRTRRNEIYMKEIDGEKTRVSEEDHMRDDSPEIYGENIVYQKRKYDDDDYPISDSIWVYNIYDEVNNKIKEIPIDTGHSSRVKARFPAIFQNIVVWEENHPSTDENISHQHDIFFTDIDIQEFEILSTKVANEKQVYSDSVDMLLVEGSELNFKAEIRDPIGKVEDVKVTTSSIPGIVNDLNMEEVKQGIYEATLDYSIDIQEGSAEVIIEVKDREENKIQSEPLNINLIEPVLQFRSAGVGTDVDEIGNNTRFILEEGNSLLFKADLSDFKGDLESVYADVSSFDIDKTVFDLEKTRENIYIYEYIYDEDDDLQLGENSVKIHASSVRGQEAESQTMTVEVMYPPSEPEIISYGIGRDLSSYSENIKFELREDNFMYIFTNVSVDEDLSYDVYLDLRDIGIGKGIVQMEDKIDKQTFYYLLDHSEEMDVGDRSVHIIVEDEFGQETRSGDIDINFMLPDEGIPTYFYFIPFILGILLVLVLVYIKKPELFEKIKPESLNSSEEKQEW